MTIKKRKTAKPVARKTSRPRKKEVLREITDYDHTDLMDFADLSKPLKLADLGIHITPRAEQRTEVVSLRLPSPLLGEIRAIGMIEDVPYTALIKEFLAEALHRHRHRYQPVERVRPPGDRV